MNKATDIQKEKINYRKRKLWSLTAKGEKSKIIIGEKQYQCDRDRICFSLIFCHKEKNKISRHDSQ
ncbi:hypothetical protein D7D81_07860 [Halocella sp. SP3-1]|nr:hypothetical protein D7D81_07860 [Halocella sp. SP3-1]